MQAREFIKNYITFDLFLLKTGQKERENEKWEYLNYFFRISKKISQRVFVK